MWTDWIKLGIYIYILHGICLCMSMNIEISTLNVIIIKCVHEIHWL